MINFKHFNTLPMPVFSKIIIILLSCFFVSFQVFPLSPGTHITTNDLSSFFSDKLLISFLDGEGFFSTSEKKLLKKLQKISSDYLSSPSEESETEKTIKMFMNDFIIISKPGYYVYKSSYNLSLFPFIFKEYQKYDSLPSSDLMKSFLRKLLNELAKSLTIIDRDASQSDDRAIKRQTDSGRLYLMDKILIHEMATSQATFPSFHKPIKFADLGASLGITTIETHERLKNVFGKVKIESFSCDRNTEQYILFDPAFKRKIFFNGVGQISQIIHEDNGQLTISSNYRDILKIMAFYDPVLKRHLNQLKKGNFASDGEYHIFKINTIDPEVGRHKEISALNIDIKKDLKTQNVQLDKLDIVRIANLLQYFADKRTKVKILKNVTQHLNEGGVIIFNLLTITEDSKYIFVLKKNTDNKITVTPWFNETLIQKTWADKIFHSIVNEELKAMQKILIELETEIPSYSFSMEKPVKLQDHSGSLTKLAA